MLLYCFAEHSFWLLNTHLFIESFWFHSMLFKNICKPILPYKKVCMFFFYLNNRSLNIIQNMISSKNLRKSKMSIWSRYHMKQYPLHESIKTEKKTHFVAWMKIWCQVLLLSVFRLLRPNVAIVISQSFNLIEIKSQIISLK